MFDMCRRSLTDTKMVLYNKNKNILRGKKINKQSFGNIHPGPGQSVQTVGGCVCQE